MTARTQELLRLRCSLIFLDFGPQLTSFKLTTNGSNLKGMWGFAGGSGESVLEDDDIYSNDIYAILKTYGVEMARAAILKEMGGVFGAYNIQVDRRHLELIADYMVRITHRRLYIFLTSSFARRLTVAISPLIEKESRQTLRRY